MRRKIPALAVLVATSLALAAGGAHAAARERAIEQIPELMGRILESQEEIREQESVLEPVLAGYNERLGQAKREIEGASSEQQAAEALVDYVETYAARLDAQDRGLRSIEGAIVRMRADARELSRAAERAGAGGSASPAARKEFFQDQFQGVASATGELAERLGREDEAGTVGAVLQSSWASHSSFGIPIPEAGSADTRAFARKVEGLYARYQARSNQIAAERRAVQRLLDMLIERQLAQRLDTLFAGENAVGLGAILAGEGTSQDWQDLGDVVARTLGLPSADGGRIARRPSLDRLDFFARGGHREQ